MKSKLLRIHSFLSSQLGIDTLLLWCALFRFRAYFKDLITFRRKYSGRLLLRPCLHDRFEESGTINNEYFWQDLLVARWIYEARPYKHVDIGSRVDGFVAHVASFRDLEVLDIRPIYTVIPGISFLQVDLMSPESVASLSEQGDGYCDSLSCLHVLEHLGLGRYGDPVKADGYRQGLAHLASLLKPEGKLYLSTPIGQERVEFNANWVFAPQTILEQAADYGLKIVRFMTYNYYTGLVDINLNSLNEELQRLADSSYHLGIMQFVKAD